MNLNNLDKYSDDDLSAVRDYLFNVIEAYSPFIALNLLLTSHVYLNDIELANMSADFLIDNSSREIFLTNLRLTKDDFDTFFLGDSEEDVAKKVNYLFCTDTELAEEVAAKIELFSAYDPEDEESSISIMSQILVATYIFSAININSPNFNCIKEELSHTISKFSTEDYIMFCASDLSIRNHSSFSDLKYSNAHISHLKNMTDSEFTEFILDIGHILVHLSADNPILAEVEKKLLSVKSPYLLDVIYKNIPQLYTENLFLKSSYEDKKRSLLYIRDKMEYDIENKETEKNVPESYETYTNILSTLDNFEFSSFIINSSAHHIKSFICDEEQIINKRIKALPSFFIKMILAQGPKVCNSPYISIVNEVASERGILPSTKLYEYKCAIEEHENIPYNTAACGSIASFLRNINSEDVTGERDQLLTKYNNEKKLIKNNIEFYKIISKLNLLDDKKYIPLLSAYYNKYEQGKDTVIKQSSETYITKLKPFIKKRIFEVDKKYNLFLNALYVNNPNSEFANVVKLYIARNPNKLIQPDVSQDVSNLEKRPTFNDQKYHDDRSL